MRSANFPQLVLRNGTTLEELSRTYNIKVSRHKAHPNLVQLKYDQIESPMGVPLVQQCRGIILDEADNWKCIARPMDKFFNHGEGHAATINWDNARVQEKLDGSLIILYYYKGNWEVATSGTPDASGSVYGYDFTFRELFWRVWNGAGYRTDYLYPECTYMYELMTPYNRIVVPHKTNKIRLLAMRIPETGEEIPVLDDDSIISDAEWYKDLPLTVRSFPLQSMDSVLATFRDMDGLNQEGYVIVDGDFNRIKVKHPGYVALHHLRSSFSPKNLLEIIRTGESTEFLTYFPEWQDTFNEISSRYEDLVSTIETAYEGIKHLESQKDFAIEATKAPFSGALFSMRKGQVKTVREYLANANIKHIVEHLKLKDVEPYEIA